jgi:hypothetical protein
MFHRLAPAQAMVRPHAHANEKPKDASPAHQIGQGDQIEDARVGRSCTASILERLAEPCRDLTPERWELIQNKYPMMRQ